MCRWKGVAVAHVGGIAAAEAVLRLLEGLRRLTGTRERHGERKQDANAACKRKAELWILDEMRGTSPACTPPLAARATTTTLSAIAVLTVDEGNLAGRGMPSFALASCCLAPTGAGHPWARGARSTRRAMGVRPHGLRL
jgi:hypothetical protein